MPPTDNDWRFDRVDPDKWGRGCREKSCTILEDEYDEEEKAYRRVRASWSATTLATGGARGVGGSVSQDRSGRDRLSLKPIAIVAKSRHGDDARLRREPQQQRITTASCGRTTSGGSLRIRGRHQHRRPSSHHRRHRSETTTMSPERMRTADRSGGWGGEDGGGGGGSEEEFGGWCSAPEGISGGFVGRRKPHSVRGVVGGNVVAGAEWRSRGALGRRPASREAVRQLRVSERLHRLAQAMAKNKERVRRRRDDLQQARVGNTENGSGRIAADQAPSQERAARASAI